jgi:hypothetical protein
LKIVCVGSPRQHKSKLCYALVVAAA